MTSFDRNGDSDPVAVTSRIDSPAVDWLVSSEEPAVRFLARRDVLGEEIAPTGSSGSPAPSSTGK